MEILMFFLAPFVMCLILVGIHCYLGLHVLKRGVIFVDLSLAQVAGLGATVALLFDIEHDSSLSYFISLGHTLLAAALFSFARRYEEKISQEVLIGLVYALSSALVVLVVHNLSHGAEHIKEILVGKIMWVSWEEVINTGAIYSLVALIHFAFRKQIFAVTMGDKINNKAMWDFLFFALFGIVITSSVGIAGILLVFSLLIVPALMSTFFVETVKSRLFVGWGIGFLISIVGMLVSYRLDLPAGAVLVVCFTLLPLLSLLFLKRD